MEIFLTAAGMLLTYGSLLAIFSGVAAGIIIGVLPGLGAVLAITMALPLTFILPKEASIALLLGLYCGSTYGGSISAILINTPGTPASAATVLDGYPLARAGHADLALGWSTTASTIGGIIAALILAIAAPLLAKIGLFFGPIEYFALGVFALTCIISVAREDIVKGLIAGLGGLFLAVIGQDPLTGDMRFDYGSFELAAGVGLVPFLVGLFALSEVFWRMAEYDPNMKPKIMRAGFKLPSWSDLKLRSGILLKSSLIGTWIGTLPGIGATTAAMVSYAEAKRTSPRRDKFGTGEPDGIIASESANNAVTAGALIPTLSLGVPGDPITAVMLGALTLQGITPGPRLFSESGELVMFIFIALLVANIMMFVCGAALAPLFTRLLRIPEPLMMACVVVLIALGTYSINSSSFDLLIVFLSGVIGFLLRYNGFPLPPIVIGFVLCPMIEQSMRQGLIITDNSFLAFFKHPIALGIFIVTLFFLLWPVMRNRLEKRKKAQKANAI